jgi:GTP cyclohydrolase I
MKTERNLFPNLNGELDINEIANHFKAMLPVIGEQVGRKGLEETPTRFAKMFLEITKGLRTNPKELIKLFEFENDNDMPYQPDSPQLVIVQNIPFYSICEHHFLPFFGTVDIGYTPANQVLGLSKFHRIVDIIARKPHVQEKLTRELMDIIMLNLHCHGCIIRVKARHLCVEMRGAKSIGTETVTMLKAGMSTEDARDFYQQVTETR